MSPHFPPPGASIVTSPLNGATKPTHRDACSGIITDSVCGRSGAANFTFLAVEEEHAEDMVSLLQGLPTADH